jgi:TrpR-related protein YerC/YecD
MSKRRFTEDSWRKDPWFKSLVSAMRSCASNQELENFFRDIATLSELQALSERFEVAKQLTKGLSYRQVSLNTGASTTTVTRVAKFIENGEGGYRSVLRTHRHHRMGAELMKHHEHPAPHHHRDERSVSVLQKYLHKK